MFLKEIIGTILKRNLLRFLVSEIIEAVLINSDKNINYTFTEMQTYRQIQLQNTIETFKI